MNVLAFLIWDGSWYYKLAPLYGKAFLVMHKFLLGTFRSFLTIFLVLYSSSNYETYVIYMLVFVLVQPCTLYYIF